MDLNGIFTAINQILRCGILVLPFIFLQAEQPGRIRIEPVSGPYNNSEDPHFNFKNKILTFVDQYKGKICNYDSKTRKTECTCPLDEIPVGPAVPIQNSENEYLVGAGPFLIIVKWNWRSKSKPTVITLGRYDGNAPGSVFNDGKADCKGRLFIDTRGKQLTNYSVERNQASLFHYSKENCNLNTNLDKTGSFYNGVAWNCNYTRFYLIESNGGVVYRFDYDFNTATISNQTIAFDFESNNVTCFPDGMTIDHENKLWIACFNGSRVVRLDPERGTLVETLFLPVSGPTATAWGGENLDILYITTSQLFLSKKELNEQPLAGYVLAIHGLGTKGLPANDAVICTTGSTCGENGGRSLSVKGDSVAIRDSV